MWLILMVAVILFAAYTINISCNLIPAPFSLSVVKDEVAQYGIEAPLYLSPQPSPLLLCDHAHKLAQSLFA